MVRFISLTLFAFIGLATAAPAYNQETANAIAQNFIDTEITKYVSSQTDFKLVKRKHHHHDDDDDEDDNEPAFDIEHLVRGLFDRVIDYVIEVTPLNDIAHGNYDFLYKIFTDKVGEIMNGMANGDGVNKIALPDFGNPSEQGVAPEQAPEEEGNHDEEEE